MTRRLLRSLVVAGAAAFGGLTQPGTASSAPATFIDAGAWNAAAATIAGFQVLTMPAVAADRITMSDSFGSWTLAEQDSAVATGTQPWGSFSRPRSEMFSAHPRLADWAGSGPGEKFATFGCDSAVFPCLGMQVVEFAFDTPIHGFAGSLAYYWGYGEYYRPGTGDGFISGFEGLDGLLFRPFSFSPRYEGFYGVIFDEPVTTLRFAWGEGRAIDGSAYFHFRDMVALAMPVPEPPLAATLALGLLILAGGGRGAGLALSRRGGAARRSSRLG